MGMSHVWGLLALTVICLWSRTTSLEYVSLGRMPAIPFSQFSRSAVSPQTLCPHGLQHTRLPGFAVYHQLPELAQAHAHLVCDAFTLTQQYPLLPTHGVPSTQPILFLKNSLSKQGLSFQYNFVYIFI